MILDEVIRMTNRRVNAIEHVIIPRLENTISVSTQSLRQALDSILTLDLFLLPLQYIVSELDEMDREEFFRLKKVQAKKKKTAAEEEQKRKAKKHDSDDDEDGDQKGGGDMLSGGKDEDVIF